MQIMLYLVYAFQQKTSKENTSCLGDTEHHHHNKHGLALLSDFFTVKQPPDFLVLFSFLGNASSLRTLPVEYLLAPFLSFSSYPSSVFPEVSSCG